MQPTNLDFYFLQPRAYPERLSLFIPVYNEEEVIPPLREAVHGFMAQLRCEMELILVNDGSTDST